MSMDRAGGPSTLPPRSGTRASAAGGRARRCRRCRCRRRGAWAGSLPGPFNEHDVPGPKLALGAGPGPRSRSLQGDGSPGSSRPFPTPSPGRSQQQSFLKKMLVMATAPANSGQARAPQLSPAVQEKKGRSQAARGWGLAPGQTITLLLRWPGSSALRLFPGVS